MSRESMRKPEIHSVATFSIVIPGSEILRWFKPQNVGTMVIAEVVPSHLCYKWMGMAGCAVFSCHFLHSRKNCSMELCFLRCHIEVNKHLSVQESAIFSYKFARIGSRHQGTCNHRLSFLQVFAFKSYSKCIFLLFHIWASRIGRNGLSQCC